MHNFLQTTKETTKTQTQIRDQSRNHMKQKINIETTNTQRGQNRNTKQQTHEPRWRTQAAKPLTQRQTQATKPTNSGGEPKNPSSKTHEPKLGLNPQTQISLTQTPQFG